MNKITWLKEELKSIIMRCFWLLPIKKNKIAFSCFSGKSYGDSPRCIAEELLKRNIDCEMIWFMLKGYNADFPNSIIRKPYNSLSLAYHLATSKVWIDSHTKWDFVRKRKGQIYIETWHGMLSKKVEGDAKEALSEDYLNRTKHNAELADFFISNSDFTTKMYRRAFWYNGLVLQIGCPKNDVYFNDNREAIEKVKTKLNIPANTQIALYAPTFRVDEGLTAYGMDYQSTLRALKKRFGGQWCIIVRLHPVIMKKANDYMNYTDNVINATEYPSMQELLVSSDVYITDYSSPMFEFSLTKKPVFLLALDYDDYMNDRGWYFDYFNMPFPAARTNEQLVNNIINFSAEPYEKALKKFWDDVGLHENGKATEAIVDIILDVINEKELTFLDEARKNLGVVKLPDR